MQACWQEQCHLFALLLKGDCIRPFPAKPDLGWASLHPKGDPFADLHLEHRPRRREALLNQPRRQLGRSVLVKKEGHVLAVVRLNDQQRHRSVEQLDPGDGCNRQVPTAAKRAGLELGRVELHHLGVGDNQRPGLSLL